jgi:hypothetical protein
VSGFRETVRHQSDASAEKLHPLGRRPRRRVIVEPTRDEHYAALEELLL